MIKIVVFGAGEIGKSIAHYFLHQIIKIQLILVDIDSLQLVACMKHLSKYVDTMHLTLNNFENIDSIIATADLIFSAIPWVAHSSIINLIAVHDKSTVIVSRPAYDEMDAIQIKLQKMTQPVVIGAGLEPGLTEIMALFCANLFDRLDSLHLKCGGITNQPANNVLRYKALFGTRYLPIAIRHAYAVVDNKLIQVPRFSEIELIDIPGLGQLEAWHDGMVPWLCRYPNLSTAHTISQKTLRWPGFADTVYKLYQLGLLSENEININNVNLSPKKFIEHLYADETKLNNENNTTILHILGQGLIDDKVGKIELTLRASNLADIGLNSLAMLTGFTASIMGISMLEGNMQNSGLTFPEVMMQTTQFDNLIAQLANYSVTLDIKQHMDIASYA